MSQLSTLDIKAPPFMTNEQHCDMVNTINDVVAHVDSVEAVLGEILEVLKKIADDKAQGRRAES